jgi:hypothetical protein
VEVNQPEQPSATAAIAATTTATTAATTTAESGRKKRGPYKKWSEGDNYKAIEKALRISATGTEGKMFFCFFYIYCHISSILTHLLLIFLSFIDQCAAMAGRIGTMRHQLRENLETAAPDRSWSHITRQIGMFAYSGLT